MKVEEQELNGSSSESMRERYDIYINCADNGNGIDITTGLPLKTFEEWLNS